MHCTQRLLLLLVSFLFTVSAPIVSSESVCFSSKKQNLSFPDCLYIGAGAGISQLSPDDSNSQFKVKNNNSQSSKIHLGYYIKPKWFTELSYLDLGKVELDDRNPAITDTSEISYKTLNLSLNYLFFNPRGSWNSYARVGYNAINVATKGNLTVINQPDPQLSLGIGAHWQLSPNWFARAELDSFAQNAQQFDLSLSYLFGQSRGKKPKAVAAPKAKKTSQAKKTNAQVTDKDKDGIVDSLDKCNNTLKGALVDKTGCSVELKKTRRFNLQIQFASGSSKVPDAAIPNIRSLARFLTQYPYTVVEIAGHTDSQGSEQLNQRISQARADSVKEKLVLRFGIDAKRIKAIGYGELRPVASNRTAEGRQKNRRVIATVSPS